MVRFYLGLWSAKILTFFLNLFGKGQDDKPGLLAYRFCSNFLDKLAKPEMVVAVTGTNGKTTVSSFVANMYKNMGKTVCYNDWGANQLAGHTKCLIDCVTIFNKPKVDVAVLETDELTSVDTLPYVKPDYLIVTNICRDSIRRNANTYYIFDRINNAIKEIPDTKLILNADCPISSFLGNDFKNKKVFYGVKGNKKDTIYLADDFGFCPKCYGDIEYVYRHYRHIGKVKCKNCDFKSFDSDYFVTKYDKKYMIVKNNKKEFKFNLISSSIFNIYNQLATLTFFVDAGFKDKQINEGFKKLIVPKSRENTIMVDGIELVAQMAKGQNVSACSTVFEELSKEKDDIVLVFLMNEMYGREKILETVTWFYETDFEFLNKENIKQIVFAGPRNMDYKLRLKLAGFDDNKFTCVDDDEEMYKYINYDGIKKVYFLFEVEAVTKAMNIRDDFYNRIVEERGISK